MVKAAVLLAGMILMAGTAATARGEEKADDKKRVLGVGKWYPSLEAGIAMTQGSSPSRDTDGRAASMSSPPILR
jgi:hypothetical protein